MLSQTVLDCCTSHKNVAVHSTGPYDSVQTVMPSLERHCCADVGRSVIVTRAPRQCKARDADTLFVPTSFEVKTNLAQENPLFRAKNLYGWQVLHGCEEH
jgi:hypothetical protein